jgi:hypothetical protein
MAATVHAGPTTPTRGGFVAVLFASILCVPIWAASQLHSLVFECVNRWYVCLYGYTKCCFPACKQNQGPLAHLPGRWIHQMICSASSHQIQNSLWNSHYGVHVPYLTKTVQNFWFWFLRHLLQWFSSYRHSQSFLMQNCICLFVKSHQCSVVVYAQCIDVFADFRSKFLWHMYTMEAYNIWSLLCHPKFLQCCLRSQIYEILQFLRWIIEYSRKMHNLELWGWTLLLHQEEESNLEEESILRGIFLIKEKTYEILSIL